VELERQAVLLRERLRECERWSARLEEEQRSLAADRAALEAESVPLGARRQGWEGQCGEEARRLDLRSRELSHFAACLRRTIERLEAAQPPADGASGLVPLCDSLEQERRQLKEEMDRLRARAAAVEEAGRGVERELSDGRAQLHRERLELNRLREEVRRAVEDALADTRLREQLTAVQHLRDELSACGPDGPAQPSLGPASSPATKAH
jgi:chromosome segregation ATPase